jgi:TonB-dependent starch-binding outer membrane protein SusC
MKKNWIWHTEPFPCFTKTWRIMRLSVFFLCVMAAQTWALDSYSQGTRLSLNLKDTRVIDILGEIEEKTEFYFLFNQKLLDVERRVDIEVRQRKIDDILNELFAGTNVNYLVMNRQIVLTTAQPGSEEYQQQTSEQQQGQVSGKVTDRAGAPLPGVTVVIKGTTTGTITNADGLIQLVIYQRMLHWCFRLWGCGHRK